MVKVASLRGSPISRDLADELSHVKRAESLRERGLVQCPKAGKSKKESLPVWLDSDE